jgi:hypothetical protein
VSDMKTKEKNKREEEKGKDRLLHNPINQVGK